MFPLKSGEKMPKLALGTYLSQDDELEKAVNFALAAGYRSFDTAKYYENEKGLGDALKKMLPNYDLTMKDVFITTKYFPYIQETHQHIGEDIAHSLECFGKGYIDLVLVHYPRSFDSTDTNPKNKEHRKEVWQELERLQQKGEIKTIGVSNYEIRHIEEMNEYAKIKPSVNQVEFHPHFQRGELREYCVKNDILFQAFSPLGRQNKTLLEDPKLVGIAEKHSTSVPVVILAWEMRKGVGVAVKSVSKENIEKNFTALELELDDEDMEIINNLDRKQPYVEDNGWECE